MKVKIDCRIMGPRFDYIITVCIWKWNGTKLFGSKGNLLSTKSFDKEEDAGDYILKMEAYYKHLI